MQCSQPRVTRQLLKAHNVLRSDPFDLRNVPNNVLSTGRAERYHILAVLTDVSRQRFSSHIYTADRLCDRDNATDWGLAHFSHCDLTLHTAVQVLFCIDFFTFYVILCRHTGPTRCRAGCAPTNFWWSIDWLIRFIRTDGYQSECYPDSTKSNFIDLDTANPPPRWRDMQLCFSVTTGCIAPSTC